MNTEHCTCKGCGMGFSAPHINVRYCHVCRNDPKRLMAAERTRRSRERRRAVKQPLSRKICGQCGKAFTPLTVRHKYCSERCHQYAPRRMGVCKHCGIEFGINQRKSKNIEHCSRECRGRSLSEAAYKPPFSSVSFEPCGACLRAFCAHSKRPNYCGACTARYGTQVYNVAAGRTATSCRICGIAFSRLPGTRMMECGDTCSSIWAARIHANKRALKYKHKSIRRGIERTGEKFDPFEIFARDGWHCCQCGCSTPQHKRGSYDDDAPELDHVIPLSAGGRHARANTQLLCRRCNGRKSNRLPKAHQWRLAG